jgi:hypothetical protein
MWVAMTEPPPSVLLEAVWNSVTNWRIGVLRKVESPGSALLLGASDQLITKADLDLVEQFVDAGYCFEWPVIRW